MPLDPVERTAVEHRIIAVGKLIDAIEAKLDATHNPIDAWAALERAKLFKERAGLNAFLT